MLTSIVVGSQDFVNISAAYINGAGVRLDPISALAIVYRVDQTTGALARETGIGADGVVTLLQQDAQVGFWGAGEDISEVAFGQFVVLFVSTFVAGESAALDTFVIEAGIQGPTIEVTLGVPVDRG